MKLDLHTLAPANLRRRDAERAQQDAETKKAEANAKKAEQDAETNKAEAEKAEEDGKKAKENANIAATDETVESEQAAEAAKKAEEAKPAGSLSKSEQAEEAAMRSLKAEDSALAQPAVNEGKWGNRRAAWASYIRTLEPATKRGCKTEKCPEGIALQIIAGGDKMRTQYFNLFYKYEEWGRVVASEEHMKIVSTCTRTMDCWLTAGQIMDLYKDEAVKNEIIKEKIASRHTWRPHPEIPAIKAAIQYLCAVKDEKVNEAQHIVKSAFKWEGELQGAEEGTAAGANNVDSNVVNETRKPVLIRKINGKPTASQFRGVRRWAHNGHWYAKYGVHGKEWPLGNFKKEDDAARGAYFCGYKYVYACVSNLCALASVLSRLVLTIQAQAIIVTPPQGLCREAGVQGTRQIHGQTA